MKIIRNALRMKSNFSARVLILSAATLFSCHRGSPGQSTTSATQTQAVAPTVPVQGSWKIQQVEAVTKEVVGRYLLHDIPAGQVVLVVAATIASLGNSTLYSEAISVSTMETAGATFLGIGSGPSFADPRFTPSEVVLSPEGRMNTLEEGTGDVTFGVGRTAGKSYVSLGKKPVHLFMAFAIERPRDTSFSLHLGDTSVAGTIQRVPNAASGRLSALIAPAGKKVVEPKMSPWKTHGRILRGSQDFQQSLVLDGNKWLREQDGKVLQATLRVSNTAKTTERLPLPILNGVEIHSGDSSKKALACFTGDRGTLAVGMEGQPFEIEIAAGETIELLYYIPAFQGKGTLEVTGLGTSTVEAP